MKRLLTFWGNHFLWLELVVAIALASTFVVWAEWFDGKTIIVDVMKDNRGAVYGALTSVFGSLLGFAITAESIVLGLWGSERLTVVRESKHYATLWRVFMATIRSLGLATACCLLGLVFDRDGSPNRIILYLCFAASLLAIARLIRCIWVLEKVVLLVSGPSKERKGGE